MAGPFGGRRWRGRGSPLDDVRRFIRGNLRSDAVAEQHPFSPKNSAKSLDHLKRIEDFASGKTTHTDWTSVQRAYRKELKDYIAALQGMPQDEASRNLLRNLRETEERLKNYRPPEATQRVEKGMGAVPSWLQPKVRDEEEAERLDYDKIDPDRLGVDRSIVRVDIDPSSTDVHGLAAATRKVLSSEQNRGWVSVVNDVRRRAGRRTLQDALFTSGFAPKNLNEVAGDLHKRRNYLQGKARALRRAGRADEANKFARESVAVAGALAYLEELRKEVERAKVDAYDASAGRIYEGLDASLGNFFERLRDRRNLGQRDLDAIGKEIERREQQLAEFKAEGERLGIPGYDEKAKGLKEQLDRLEEQRTVIKGVVEKRASAQKSAAAERAVRQDRDARERGLKADSLDDLWRRVEAAKATVKDPKATAAQKERAYETLQNAPRTKVDLARRAAFEREVQADRAELERTRRLRDKTHDEALREVLRERADSLEGMIKEKEDALERAAETGDYKGIAPGGRTHYRAGIFAEAGARARVIGARASEYTTNLRQDVVNPIRNNKAVKRGAEGVADSFRAAGYGWLWTTQAKRYRRQEETSVKAQRIARSGLWKWWYTFSDPVRRTIAMAMVVAPAMVPFGIFQYAGWFVFGLFAFIVNVLYRSVVEVINLVLFGFLSIVNIVGNAMAGVAAMTTESFLALLGQEDVYTPLAFDFGVQTLRAAPLIDPRLFFPTIFNNNSLLSVGLAFLGGVPWQLIAAIGFGAAVLIPVILMEKSRWEVRVFVGLAIVLVTVPGIVGQLYLQTNFYELAADAFRTGVGNRFAGPAAALAEQARLAMVGDAAAATGVG